MCWIGSGLGVDVILPMWILDSLGWCSVVACTVLCSCWCKVGKGEACPGRGETGLGKIIQDLGKV